MSGKGADRLHARTQAPDFADRWAATFGQNARQPLDFGQNARIMQECQPSEVIDSTSVLACDTFPSHRRPE